MGFSKKDLGDVVWSSETGRDPVFLTSRPKDIDYPQLLSIQTLDRRTTGATLFQMERRPFICSGLVQAETAYRRTNTDVSGTARASSTLPTRCRSFLRDDPIGAVFGPQYHRRAPGGFFLSGQRHTSSWRASPPGTRPDLPESC